MFEIKDVSPNAVSYKAVSYNASISWVAHRFRDQPIPRLSVEMIMGLWGRQKSVVLADLETQIIENRVKRESLVILHNTSEGKDRLAMSHRAARALAEDSTIRDIIYC
jgi:hypothetical protein